MAFYLFGGILVVVGFFQQQGCLTSGGSLTGELSFSSLYVRYTYRFVFVLPKQFVYYGKGILTAELFPESFLQGSLDSAHRFTPAGTGFTPKHHNTFKKPPSALAPLKQMR